MVYRGTPEGDPQKPRFWGFSGRVWGLRPELVPPKCLRGVPEGSRPEKKSRNFPIFGVFGIWVSGVRSPGYSRVLQGTPGYSRVQREEESRVGRLYEGSGPTRDDFPPPILLVLQSVRLTDCYEKRWSEHSILALLPML